MPDLLPKLVSRQSSWEPLPEDSDLEQFFTDAEYALQVFEELVTADRLPKRLLVVHGVGGVGKSTLLRMYRLSCYRHRIPVALVGAEDAPSSVDVLASWAEDLSNVGIKLRAFAKTLNHYRALQSKVEAKAEKAKEAMRGAAGELGKVVAKTAVEMAASTIPVIGPLVAALGGTGTEAAIDWLRGFLSKPDLEFYLDPSKRLTDDFLNDLARAAARQRTVLMADTYEQMAGLDEWMRGLTQQLPENVLLIIAGRVMPEWDRAWMGWMGQAEIVELKEMTLDDQRTLVRRYYAYIRGGEPDPEQVEAIAEFARGLPIAATTVVRLWVRHGVEDFHTVKAQVVADLADRLLEGVPPEMRPVFEAAAVLRYFNADSLRALLDHRDADALYAELRRWPFIRSRREGLAVHDTMREMVNEALRMRTPERFRTLHGRAAEYYEVQLEKATGDERERIVLERFYHLIQSGEELTALAESQPVIEMALGYYQRLFAESIIVLLDRYLQQEYNRCWLVYLRHRVIRLNPSIERRMTAAKALATMLDEPGLDRRLWALFASALAAVPAELDISFDKRIELLEQAMGSGLLSSQEITEIYGRMGRLYRVKAEWEKAIENFTKALQLCKSQGNPFGETWALGWLAYTFLLMGEWTAAVEWAQSAVALSRQLGGYALTKHLKTLGWAYTYRGELNLALNVLEESLRLAQEQQDEAEIIRVSRRLAEIYDRQRRWALAVPLHQDLIARNDKYGRVISKATCLALLGISYLKQGLYEQAEQLFLESLTHIDLHVEPIALNGLGELYLVLGRLSEAHQYYEHALSVSKGRPYYVAQAALGLLWVDVISLTFQSVLENRRRIEELSMEHAYHDHLANLRLTQGHVSWEAHIPEWGSGFEAALSHYQQALIYALRYNRFLLDEVLWGGGVATPLRPIVPHCLEWGEEGRRMLFALRDWWQSGTNDIGAPRPDTISPIPEGIPLLEAERIAREREPGDRSLQKTVVEQIEAALTTTYGG